MIQRIAIAAAILGWFCVAAPTIAAERSSAYAFVTLYSPEYRLLPDRTGTKTPVGSRDAYQANASFPDRRGQPSSQRSSWKDRIPWWREEVIERGTLPPFGQERAFEQSLESGRTYYESSQHAQGTGGSFYGAGQAGRSEGVLSSPEIAAVLWRESTRAKTASKSSDDTLPGIPKPGPSIVYKGLTLIGSSYADADNEAFFRSMRKAIDAVTALPKELGDIARRIETVAYDPPSKHRQAAGVILDIDGVYVIYDRQRKAPLILYKDIRSTSVQRIALSLIGGGVMATRHERLMSLLRTQEKPKLKTDRLPREIEDRLAPIEATNPALVNEAECELQSLLHRADKALDVSAELVRARLRLIRQRNCR